MELAGEALLRLPVAVESRVPEAPHERCGHGESEAGDDQNDVAAPVSKVEVGRLQPDERSELQSGKKVLPTILDVCPLVALAFGLK